MKILDANGANIPALGFGTWQLRGATCTRLVTAAIEHGYRHVDTAITYENEREVGQGIADASVPRDEIFLTTKVWPDQVGKGDLQRALAGSLERLAVDDVDLVLVHWPSKSVPFEETARALEEVVATGMARHVGVSNFTMAQVAHAAETLDVPLACNQVERHPYLDQSRLRDVMRPLGAALVAYCPLFRGGNLFSDETIVEIAGAHGKTPAQVVLRWHVQSDGCGAIPKTQTPSRMEENFAVFDFELSHEEMARIDALGRRDERICDYEFSPEWDPSPYEQAA